MTTLSSHTAYSEASSPSIYYAMRVSMNINAGHHNDHRHHHYSPHIES